VHTRRSLSIRRCIAAIFLAAAVVGVPVAQASPPTISAAPAQDIVDTTSCDFPVSVHFTVNRQTAKTFPSGAVLITGPLKAEYSANGHTVSLNIAGPVSIRPQDDSVSIVGRGVGAGPVVTSSGVTLAYVAGPVSISPSGEAVLEHGTILLDICQALG
jgi:hypothetical protein